MGTDLDKLRKYKKDRATGRNLLIPEGDSLVYIAPPAREDWDLPFLETAVHFGFPGGPKLCLNSDRNPLLKDPEFLKVAKKAGVDVNGPCKICQKLSGKPGKPGLWDTDKEAARKISASNRFLMIAGRLWGRKDSTDSYSPVEPFELKPLPVGKKIWEAVVDIFLDLEVDLTDPLAAILIKFHREGTGLESQYNITADPKTTKKPLRLGKAERRMIREALAEGSDCDPYLAALEWYTSPEEMSALLEGVDLDDDDEDDDDDDEVEAKPPKKSKKTSKKKTSKKKSKKKPTCFGIDYSSDDEDCEDCEFRSECADESGHESDDDEDEDEDDEVDEVEDDDEDDEEEDSDDEDSDDDDEDEDDEDDEDEDDSDEDLEDLEAALDKKTGKGKKSKKKPVKSSKKKTSKKKTSKKTSKKKSKKTPARKRPKK